MIIIMIYLSHILADFTLQTDYVAKHKQDEIKRGRFFKSALFEHLIVHFVIMIVLIFVGNIIFGYDKDIILISLLLAIILLTHGTIDYYLVRVFKKLNSLNLFLFDQTLHLVIIGVFGYLLLKQNLFSELSFFLDAWDDYFKWLLLILVLLSLTFYLIKYSILKRKEDKRNEN